MAKSLYDANMEAREKYKTSDNTFEMFPVGTKVKVICLAQDMNFFRGETGVVIENKGSYLGIIVKFDEPRHFKDGSVQKDFNFAPDDLIVKGSLNWRYCFMSDKFKDKEKV